MVVFVLDRYPFLASGSEVCVSQTDLATGANVAIAGMGKPSCKTVFMVWRTFGKVLKCPVPSQTWGHPAAVTT